LGCALDGGVHLLLVYNSVQNVCHALIITRL
jgi:hypothetical protein